MKKISKIISILLLSISLIIFLYLVYRTELYDVRYLYYKKYFIISFALVFLSIISFYFNDNLKINLSLFLFFLIFPIYCFESILHFQEWNNRVGDKRTMEKFYKDALKKGKKISPTIPPSAFLNFKIKDYNPLSLISNSKIVNCNENGEYVVNKSDRFGFNTDNETWDKENIDFVLVGDSFTYGYCEKRSNNFDGHIKKNSEFKNIINFGMGGNGPLINYATLREYYPKNKNVDTILWFFYPNDFNDLNNELNSEVLLRYLNDENFLQNLIKKDDYKNKIYQDFVYNRFQMKKFRFILLTKTRNYILKKFSMINPNNETNRYYNDKNLLIFKNIMELVLKIDENAKLYFIYIPEYEQFFTDNYNHKHKKKVIEIIKELNIPIIDLENIFKESKNHRRLFSKHPIINHYSSDGYSESVKFILKNLD